MSESKQNGDSLRGSIVALLPLLLFLSLYIGVGIYLSFQGVEYAFYQLPAPVAILPAIIVAFILDRFYRKKELTQSLSSTLEDFLRGVGHPDIIAMCMIYLLAGAFAAVAKASGGVDATVNLGLSAMSPSMILPGIFIISAFIATAMGTSMGTIAAVAPVALGIAESAELSLSLTAGVVLSGAMFGDNLSIISDTTIAATRSQGCKMKDKFKENIRMALPAAIASLILFTFFSASTQVPQVQEIHWIKVIPYITILILAIAGVNVFAVLSLGIFLAGIIGLSTLQSYSLTTFSQDIYAGFGNMQEIFLLSLLIGGLSELMKKQGGLTFLTQFISKLISKVPNKLISEKRTSEYGIALLVSAINFCTANNTVAIIVSGSVAKNLAQKNDIDPKRSASILDIFSCVVQGILPYGAQVLLLGSVFKLSPLEIISHSYYCLILALVALILPSRQ
ncbi:MAG: sodium:proton antiporter [Halobacteriovoraceae bacterium]|nr:sodium:proton antiporter [Halobacteriovoraceae bacterium]|tara:strand:- start:38079 stop:39428 length:1350 start_codon:yes stop_codon:yes gene_type:complete